jgi:hypothetical protein
MFAACAWMQIAVLTSNMFNPLSRNAPQSTLLISLLFFLLVQHQTILLVNGKAMQLILIG